MSRNYLCVLVLCKSEKKMIYELGHVCQLLFQILHRLIEIPDVYLGS